MSWRWIYNKELAPTIAVGAFFFGGEEEAISIKRLIENWKDKLLFLVVFLHEKWCYWNSLDSDLEENKVFSEKRSINLLNYNFKKLNYVEY